MGSTGFAATLAFVAGLGGAVQIATQGRLGNRIGSLEALACAVFVGAALTLVVVLLALRARREEGLWGLGVATIVASPSLFSHGFLVAIPAMLGLRTTVFWVVMAITSVAPGGQWFTAIGILIAAWYLPLLGGETVRLTVPVRPRSVRP